MNEKSNSNPKDELQLAIENLEEFANQNENSSIPIVLNLDVQNNHIISSEKSKLQEKIDLSCRFISGLFSSSKPDIKRLEVQKTLLQSIEFLKTHYRLIEKLKHGTESDQELASWALKAINRYNDLIQKSKTKPKNLTSRVARFVYEQSGVTVDEELTNHPIVLPRFFSVQFSSTSSPQIATTQKVASLFGPIPDKNTPSIPTKHEVDALHMKAITLLRNHDFPVSLRTTLKSYLNESPINATICEPAANSESSDMSIVSLEQTINPFPGEVITLQGLFKRDTKSRVPSVPIPDSFHVSTKAFQTGFPHPLQHTGWSLADQFIPASALRLSDLPLFEKVYLQKTLTAQELLPEGKFNDKAKQILKIKKRIFEENCQEFLIQHELIFKALVQAAQDPDLTYAYAEPIITCFYEKLKTHPKPFEHISHIHHLINELFIAGPYNFLQEAWINGDLKAENIGDAKDNYFSALNILEREMIKIKDDLLQQKLETKEELDYLLTVGSLIAIAGKAIILQQLSETMGYPPPLLNNFEKKIQTCTFKHQLAFFEELSLDPQDPEIKSRLEEMTRKQLREEYVLFRAESSESFDDLPVKISNELEVYYNSRFYRM